MENPSNVYAGTTAVPGPLGRPSQLPEHWRLARAAHVDLLLMGMPRVNLLLIAADGVVRFVLESLLLDLQEPITTWRPGQQFTLPAADRGGTLILHDIGALTADEQMTLLDWLERAEGRTQVVSISPTALLPRVKDGSFIEVLYYRLNTVCVDVTQ
jgi:hypothetical protein